MYRILLHLPMGTSYILNVIKLEMFSMMFILKINLDIQRNLVSQDVRKMKQKQQITNFDFRCNHKFKKILTFESGQ